MTKFSVIHEVKCPGCGVDFTTGGVRVHFSIGGNEFDLLSSVDQFGCLQEPPESKCEGLIAKGLHAGSACASCGEQLEELVDDDKAQDQAGWYVRWEGTGEITGPFSKEKALELPTAGDGLVFSSSIFEPQFVTTPEVDHVIGALRTLASWTRREDRNFADVGAEVRLVSQRAIDMITLLSREKVVTCSVEGGVTEVVELPVGVKLVVYDYDIEGYDVDRLTEDESGRECVEIEFTNESQDQ